MIGSIILRHDPVLKWERYLKTLVPLGDRGPCEMYFSAYRAEDRAEGGLYSLSFQVAARENLLKELYENALGRMVEAWGYGLEPDFEGRVVEVVFNLPPDRFTISLDLMTNKTWMRADIDDDGVVERTTTIENTDSQARYGISEAVLGGGEVQGLAVGDQAIQAYIDLRAFAKPAADFGGGQGAPYVELFCRGYIHTLDMRTYNQTAVTGTQSLSSEVADIIGSVGQFIDSVETEPNTTSVSRENDADRKAKDILFDMASLGDQDAHRFLLQGAGRSCTNAIGRRVLLKQAAPVTVP